MRVEAVSKAYSNPLGPTSAEEVILGYKRVQGGFERDSVGKEAAKEESDVLNKCRKIPTAPPVINAPICRTFLRSVLPWVIDPQRMATDRHVKYRPRIDCLENEPFCRAFSPDNDHRGRCGRYFPGLYLGVARCCQLLRTP
jgi:hypothetical protein